MKYYFVYDPVIKQEGGYVEVPWTHDKNPDPTILFNQLYKEGQLFCDSGHTQDWDDGYSVWTATFVWVGSFKLLHGTNQKGEDCLLIKE